MFDFDKLPANVKMMIFEFLGLLQFTFLERALKKDFTSIGPYIQKQKEEMIRRADTKLERFRWPEIKTPFTRAELFKDTGFEDNNDAYNESVKRLTNVNT